MNSKTNDICAFPCTKVSETEMRVNGDGRSEARTDYEISGGMSLRDYFAAEIVSGLCAHQNAGQMAVNERARYAYLLADAMLAEREK